jgi:hypothetical protein
MDALPPSTSNGHVNPWERQEGESPKAFHAFCLYKDAGSERSLTKVAQLLNVSKQLLGRWSSQHQWVRRALAWDDHQHRVINHGVLTTLVRQAQTWQRAANTALETITSNGEMPTIPELCLMLRTVVLLAECANGGGNGESINNYRFPANLPSPVFNIVTYSKPESHSWVRHNDDPEAKEGFHVPREIAVAIKQQFPQYVVVI